MATNADTERSVSRSQLFTLRLWPEDLGGGKTDWRGKVQHVDSGEARYFRDWSTLEAFLQEVLGRIDQEQARAGMDESGRWTAPTA